METGCPFCFFAKLDGFGPRQTHEVCIEVDRGPDYPNQVRRIPTGPRPWRVKRAKGHRDLYESIRARGLTAPDAIKEVCKRSGLADATIRRDLKIAGCKEVTGRRTQ